MKEIHITYFENLKKDSVIFFNEIPKLKTFL